MIQQPNTDKLVFLYKNRSSTKKFGQTVGNVRRFVV